jgi:hypothetical protein
MVAGTLSFKRDKPDEELPSISEEMQKAQANQSTIDKQLKHANEQIALTRTYPGRISNGSGSA